MPIDITKSSVQVKATFALDNPTREEYGSFMANLRAEYPQRPYEKDELYETMSLSGGSHGVLTVTITGLNTPPRWAKATQDTLESMADGRYVAPQTRLDLESVAQSAANENTVEATYPV